MGKNPPHVFAGKVGLKRLERIVSPGWHVGKEDPVVVSEWAKPEPDLSVVRGTENDYLDRAVTAADVALVIEIAESSLATDGSDMGCQSPTRGGVRKGYAARSWSSKLALVSHKTQRDVLSSVFAPVRPEVDF
jgi:hypothetical protein